MMLAMNIEKFISAIRRERAIWSNPSNANKYEKTKAWDRICAQFYDGYDGMEEKDRTIITMLLKRRWKSMKDCYGRERLKQRQESQLGEGCYRRQYRFFHLLQFLNERSFVSSESGSSQNRDEISLNTEDNSTRDDDEDNMDEVEIPIHFVKNEVSSTAESANIGNEEDEDDEYRDYEIIRIPSPSTSVPRNEDPVGKVNNEREITEESVLLRTLSDSLLQRSNKEREQDGDPDRMFMLSLVPELKKIPEERKLDAKIEIMNIIKNAKSNFTFLPRSSDK